MKKIYSILFCAIALLTTVACEDSNKEMPEAPEVTVGAYILNSGKYGDNNGSLTYYDADTAAIRPVTQKVFLARNGKDLGDTSNDMIIYGSKMYIAVYHSGVLFVTDKQGTIIEEIKLEDYKQPRCLTSYNGKVYASYYDRGIVQIDTATFATKTAPIGINAEEITVSNGKLYVAISQAMTETFGTTVEVIDPVTLKKDKAITVGLNPTKIATDNNDGVYVVSNGKSWGNVADQAPAVFQRINSTTGEVSKISIPEEYGTVLHIAMGPDNKLFVIAGVSDASTGWELKGEIYIYDTSTQRFAGKFVTDGTTIDKMYCLSTDVVNGDVYVGTSDYSNDGDVYIFGADGKLKTTIEVGLNPMTVVPVRTR